MRTYFSSHVSKSCLLFILLVLAFTAYASAATPAGRVDFAFGTVTATGADNVTRTIVKGAEIFSGDSIVITDGRAQLRFTDGAYVSLQANTVFKVDQYLYEGKSDGKEKASFSLVKGGLRTITGAIGKVNKQNYEVRTPTATIGIRGTAYSANQSEDGLTVSVTQGLVSVSNQGGSMTLAAGQSALVRTPTSGPEMTNPTAPTSSIAPANPTAQTQNQEQYPMLPPGTATVAGEQRAPDGSSLPLATIASGPASGPGYTVIAADGISPLYTNPNVTATFTGPNLVAFNIGIADISTSAQVVDSGWDGLIGWGRWTSGTTDYSIIDPSQGLHYVVGKASPQAALDTLALSNPTVTYSLVGATSPSTTSGGITTLGTFSGSLNVNFSVSGASMQMNANITDSAAGINYNLSAAGSLPIGLSPTFTTSGTFDTGAPTPISVNGFFAGASAERLGISYVIDNTQAGMVTTGSAAFKAP